MRTLVSHRHYRRRDLVRLSWDGRYEDGRLVPDGVYRPRIDLPRRTPILMPNTIEVDTRPPRVRVTGTTRPVISPDGDGRFDGFTIAYALDAPARGVLYVDGRRLALKRSVRQADEFRWYGRLDGGRPRTGTYAVAVGALDEAGNESPPSEATPVRIRFIQLARETVRAKARTRFGVGVRSDVRRFRWRFAGRRGGRAPACSSSARPGPAATALRGGERPRRQRDRPRQGSLRGGGSRVVRRHAAVQERPVEPHEGRRRTTCRPRRSGRGRGSCTPATCRSGARRRHGSRRASPGG